MAPLFMLTERYWSKFIGVQGRSEGNWPKQEKIFVTLVCFDFLATLASITCGILQATSIIKTSSAASFTFIATGCAIPTAWAMAYALFILGIYKF